MGQENFADSFAKFLLTVFPDDQNPFEPRHSTTSGGRGEFGDKDTQAGSISVAYVYNKRNTRTHAAGEQETQTNFNNKRYSDVSVYCHTLSLYCISGELKSNNDAAAFQNLEQLLGLWRPKQKFMLGWTINPTSIIYRLLVRRGEELVLYELKQPNNNSVSKALLGSLFDYEVS